MTQRKRKLKVLVVVGPTAVGKTATSITLAQKYRGEIISGDSMQVYRKLDIGTAKIKKDEKQGIPHHMLDCRNITESYSVADFQKEGRKWIADIAEKGHLPIVVGGTGLYIQSLLYDFDLGNSVIETTIPKEKYRKQLQEFYKKHGAIELWQRLNKLDKASAETVHVNNVKRVMRLLEMLENEGGIPSNRKPKEVLYDVKFIGLTTERSVLYERINQRVQEMLPEGLLEEANYVYQHQACQAAQGIGYKEFFPYFAKQISLSEAIQQVQQNSRRYAKRQLTWFHNRMQVEWYDLIVSPNRMSTLENNIEKWLANEEEVT